MKLPMRIRFAWCRPHLVVNFFLMIAVTGAYAATKTLLEFREGDRVVLIGDTFVEREGSYGYMEQRLTSQFPDCNVQFRNLGWSGDTPQGSARASFDFDKPGKGFEKLKEEVAASQPSVVILGYGMASSLEKPPATPAQFKADMLQLMDAVQSVTTNGPVRFILLSPVRHEGFGMDVREIARHNETLGLYTKALAEIAESRNCAFVSLFDALSKGRETRTLTDNGIHLNALGYRRAAEVIARGLGWPEDAFVTRVGSDDPLLAARGELPLISQRAEELRQAIVKKNELFFDRWRPQNETYLFGFRKYEQGQNAKEIPMFDPLILKEEAKIAELRKPVRSGAAGTPSWARHSRPSTPGTSAPVDSSSTKESRHELHELAQNGAENEPRPEFEIAPGFEVNLFAESPLLAKPTQMNFDPQGRLWIASSAVYPQIEPGREADDKILVLEDTNGDGFAEKSTVFAEGLLIPTAVIPGDGGCYVGQSTELLHFRDIDGDGKADEKRIVLSGFGTEDTHHMVHTLRWGPDGQLYFNQSIYIHSHFETPHGLVHLNSGGVWHLRPSTMELGVFLRGFCNPWGHDFDEFGQSFVTDGAGYQGLSFGIPGATYFTYANMRRELKSISPGNYPKFCGLEIIRSTQFPPEWQGNAITCDFRAHRVVRFGIEEQGAGYAARELSDLVRSTNVTFRPIDVKLGPDGALYVADWSNPIIQHGEVDFRDPRRDHEHGRIWRITAKDRPLVKRHNFVKESNKELLEHLVSPNVYDEEQAKRVLVERAGVKLMTGADKGVEPRSQRDRGYHSMEKRGGPDVQHDLADWTKRQSSEKALLEALWMYQGLDVVEPKLLERLLNAQDAHIRAAATRAVSYWHSRLKDPLNLLAQRIEDTHPRVRLEAIRALAEIPTARSAELVLGALDKPIDSFLDYGIWLSINDLADPWIAWVKEGKWQAAGREKQLEFALKAIEPAKASAVLGTVLEGRLISRDGSGPWIELIGTAGDAKSLRRMFEQTLKGGFDETASVRVLKALNVAAQRGGRPTGSLEEIGGMLPDETASLTNNQMTTGALRLVGSWKLEGFIPRLIAFARSNTGSSGLRQAAFDALREIGGKGAISALEPLTSQEQPLAVRRQAVLTLAALDLEEATRPATEILIGMTNESSARDFWRMLLSIKGAGSSMARALPKTGLPPAMAKAGLRAAREGGRNEPDLVWALTRGADLEGEAQTLSAAELMELAGRVVKEGDAARGEAIFRRKELGCVTCHAIGGVGGKVGPDLTSIGASAQVDYLIESVLYPNRKIKEGYHSVIVETKDGMDLSGVLVSENSDEIVLRDATGKDTAIAKNNIQNRTTGNSLMPGGVVDALNPAERLDLYRFLSELGKPGEYDASKPNVARGWKLFVQTLDVTQFRDEKVLKTDLADSKWISAHSLVDGRLLKDELAASMEGLTWRDPQAVFAAARFQVAKSGRVNFRVLGITEASAWVDGKACSINSDFQTELEAGTHTLYVKLNAKNLPESIRVESPEAAFLPN
jgi:putative heme-binding domain-containing protein